MPFLLAAAALLGAPLGGGNLAPAAHAEFVTTSLSTCTTEPFTDVPTSHPQCPEITWLKDEGITNGYGDGTYRPDSAATRMAVAAFLSRLTDAVLVACSAPPFTDVPISHTFCPDIQWMQDQGITNGYGDGTYRPTMATTRMTISAFLARVAGATLVPCTAAPFSDVPMSHQFCPEITWMKDNAISDGNGDGSFGPLVTVTRADAAVMLYLVSLLLNVAPVAVDQGPVAVDEDDSVTITLTGTDADDDDLTFSIVTGPTKGTLGAIGAPDCSAANSCSADVLYTTTANLNGADSFTFKVNDGTVDSADGTVSIDITPINDAPVGGVDSAETVANVQLFFDSTPGAGVPATTKSVTAGANGDGVLANDSDPVEGDNISITGIVGCGDVTAPFVCNTTGGGEVTLQTDGSFSFIPDDGDTAADSFQYVLNDDGTPSPASSNVTVNLTFVGNRIWFVKNDAPAGGLGRSHDPFDTLAEAQAAATAANDRVFVYFGDGTTTNQNSGFTFGADGQTLQGEAVALTTGATVNGTSNATLVAAGSQPLIGNAAGNGVTSTNRLSTAITGLSIAGSSNAVELGFSGAATGTYSITNNTIRGASAEGIEVDLALGTSGTATLNITNNTWNTAGTHTGNAIDINREAATLVLTVSNNSNILSTGAAGIVINGGSATSTAIRGFAGNSVHGNTAGAGISISNVDFDASSDPATQQVDGDTLAVGASGNPVGGAGMSITSSQGNLFFDDMDIFAAVGTALNLTETGAGLTFGVLPAAPDNTGTSTIDADNGAGLVATGVTLSLLLADFDSTTTGAAITLDGVGNQFRAPTGSTISKTSGAGTAVSISNSSAPLVFNYAGTINVTSGAGIALSNNTGSTLNFSGTLTLSTATNAAFAATGGGTVNVTGASNTLTTTTATALNVANTTIGASGLTFQSVSANGAASGIVLNSTGSSGGLTVTGGGSTAQGGDNSGGTIQNTTSHGISLNNTSNVSLNNVRVDNTGDQGINGVLVNTFSFTYGTINNAGSGSDEGAISFDDGAKNISGALTVTNSNLTLVDATGIDVEQSDGTFTNVVISNNTFTSEQGVTDPTPGSAVRLVCNATTTTACTLPKATLSGNTIGSATNSFNEAGFVIQANTTDNAGSLPATLGVAGSGTDVISVTGNFMNGGGNGLVTDIGFQADRFITAALNGKGTSNFDISNNGSAGSQIRNIDGVVIELSNFGAGTMTATVNNNIVNANNAVGSAGLGIGCDSDSFAATTDNGTFTLTIDGNNVQRTDGPGIFAIARNSSCTLNVRISNNTVAAPFTTNAARAGIRVDSGSSAGDTTLCLTITGNTTAGSTNTGTGTISPGINLRKQGTDAAINVFGIEGMAATSSPGVENYVNGLNTSTSGTFGTGGTALLSATSGFSNCSSAP